MKNVKNSYNIYYGIFVQHNQAQSVKAISFAELPKIDKELAKSYFESYEFA